MITQGLFDWWAQFVAGLIGLIPDLPAAWQSSMAAVTNGAYQTAALAGKFSPIVPWDLIGVCVTIFAAVLGYWGILFALRTVLHWFNR